MQICLPIHCILHTQKLTKELQEQGYVCANNCNFKDIVLYKKFGVTQTVTIF